MFSYSGQRIDAASGSPTLNDVAVGLGRIARFAGQSEKFYPVLLHSLLVGDLVPSQYELFGLLHDAMEAVTGDCVGPFKTTEMCELEDRMWLRFMWERFGIETLPEGWEGHVKQADQRALFVEARRIGARGLVETLRFDPTLTVPDPLAEERFDRYQMRYLLMDLVTPAGAAVRDFKERVESAWKRYKCTS